MYGRQKFARGKAGSKNQGGVLPESIEAMGVAAHQTNPGEVTWQ